jgi:hypothetical protein
MPLPRVFDTAIPYVFSMCGVPGDGWNNYVIAMATFRLSSFLSEEWCPLERIQAIASSLILFTSGATWHLLLAFKKDWQQAQVTVTAAFTSSEMTDRRRHPRRRSYNNPDFLNSRTSGA